MKNTVRTISLILVLAFCLSTACFASAQSSSNSLEGTWKLTSISGNFEEQIGAIVALALVNKLGGEISYTFSGGRFLVYVNMFGLSEVQYGSYRTSGDWLVMTNGNTEWMKYDIIGSMLIMNDESGNSLIFTRI